MLPTLVVFPPRMPPIPDQTAPAHATTGRGPFADSAKSGNRLQPPRIDSVDAAERGLIGSTHTCSACITAPRLQNALGLFFVTRFAGTGVHSRAEERRC